jgi:hypothetical protein
MKSIFNEADYTEIVNRLNKLTPSSPRKWGKMDAAQMLAHCNMIHRQLLGKIPPGKLPNFVLRWIIKRIILSPKPYKPSLPTGPEMIKANPEDFEKEKREMLEYLEDIYRKGESYDWRPHAAIGKLTGKEWGWVLWKHLDHHFRQFSALLRAGGQIHDT